MYRVFIALSLLSMVSFHLALANPLSSLFGVIDVETPPYDVVKENTKYQVRRYRPELWAKVEYIADPSVEFNKVASIGFRSLFRYISGNNDQKKKIPMTAPVIIQQLDSLYGHRRMSFIMPASQFTSLDQLPKPNDSNVKLVAVNDPLVLACIKFNMGMTNKRIAEKELELRTAAEADSTQLVAEQEFVRVAGYNPPWTLPWFRTNEICIPLANQALI